MIGGFSGDFVWAIARRGNLAHFSMTKRTRHIQPLLT